MVTVTFDGTTTTMYVNGTSVGTSTTMVFAGGENATVRIGCNNADGSSPFNGSIDEVYIFSTALTVEQIASLWMVK